MNESLKTAELQPIRRRQALAPAGLNEIAAGRSSSVYQQLEKKFGEPTAVFHEN